MGKDYGVNSHRLALTVLALAVGLTACTDTEQTADPDVRISEPAEGSDPSQFDAGPYSTAPLTFPPVDLSTGPALELARYGDRLLLPSEIDPELIAGTGGVVVLGYEGLMSASASKAIEEMGTFMGAYRVGAYDKFRRSDVITRGAFHSLMRFTSASEAQRAVDAIAQADRAGGPLYTERVAEILELQPSENQVAPGFAVEIPGHPEIQATQKENQLVSVVAFDDMVLFIAATNENQDGDTVQDDSDTEWQTSYVTEVVEKQKPLLDGIVKRSVGVGLAPTEGWQQVDPEGMLAYTVPFTEEPAPRRPVAGGRRLLAGQFDHQGQMNDFLERAGVDATAVNLTMMARAHDERTAADLVAQWQNLYTPQDFRPYEDEQGIPGVSCMERDEFDGTSYVCALQYGRYVAFAEDREKRGALGDDGTRRKLSQLMAAQYALFTQMPAAVN